MATRSEREMRLLSLMATKDGRTQIIEIYRAILKGRDPMPVADYAAMIVEILDAEFPPKKS
jgi:hypothetical protein